MQAKNSDFVPKWSTHFGITFTRRAAYYGFTQLVNFLPECDARPGRRKPIDMDRDTARAIYDDVVALRACTVKDLPDNQAVYDAIALLGYLEWMTDGQARIVMEALKGHLEGWMRGDGAALLDSRGSTGGDWWQERG